MSSTEECLATAVGALSRLGPALPLEALRRAYELALLFLFGLSCGRSVVLRGRAVTARELGFGFAVSQSVEAMAVALGRYRYPDWLVYFPPRPALVPLGVGLGWAALLPTVMRASERLVGRAAAAWRLALVDGALAVALDLALDPIVSGPPLGMWIWRGDGMTPYRWWLFGVPLFNFAGWFVLVFACSLELRLAAARARPWAWLGACFVLDLGVAWALMRLPW